MAPSVVSVLVDQPLATNAVSLGRLVLDISAPWQDFCPFSPVDITDSDISVSEFLELQEVIERTHGTKFHVNLTEWLSLSTDKKRSLQAGIAATRGVRKFLLNSGNLLERICKDIQVREWIEKYSIRWGQHAYMCVGIITLIDASTVHRIERISDVGVAVEVPVTDLVTSGVTAMIPGPLGSILDSSVGTTQANSHASKAISVHPGEKIIAVQYRKLKYNWHLKRDVDRAFLEKGNRWFVYNVGYRSEFEEDDEDEAVEVDLDESISKDDFDMNYEEYEIGQEGQQFIIVT
jgi:hypothetical protein